MGGHGDERVTEALAAPGDRCLGEREERTAAGVAEEHHRVGAPAAHLGHGSLDVGDALLVQEVGVVVHVAPGDAEHRVAGGRERGQA